VFSFERQLQNLPRTQVWLRSDSPYKEAEAAPSRAAAVTDYRESIFTERV
jgi:hypothetical protein